MGRMSRAICFIVFLATPGVWADALQGAGSPAGGEQVADLLFILSADTATFVTADTMVLSYCSSTAQYYEKGAHAGVVPTEVFTNKTLGSEFTSSDGHWMGNPIATLYGFDLNRTNHGVVLELSAPTVNAHSRTVIFNVTVPMAASGKPSLKTRNGVANSAMEDFGNVDHLRLSDIQAGVMLFDVGLFIDSNTSAVATEARTERERDDYERRGYDNGYNRGWGGTNGGGNGGGNANSEDDDRARRG